MILDSMPFAGSCATRDGAKFGRFCALANGARSRSPFAVGRAKQPSELLRLLLKAVKIVEAARADRRVRADQAELNSR
jgi:hypothetical protein